jgi:hypothetical protein
LKEFANQIRNENIEHKEKLQKIKAEKAEKEKKEIQNKLKKDFDSKLKQVETEKNDLLKELEYYKKMMHKK